MFVKKLAPNQKACHCRSYFPDSHTDQSFAPGSIWACDNCGRAWYYNGTTITDQSLKTTKDNWDRITVHDVVPEPPLFFVD